MPYVLPKAPSQRVKAQGAFTPAYPIQGIEKRRTMTRNTKVLAVLTTMLGLAGCSTVQPIAAPVPASNLRTQSVSGPTELLVKFRVQATPQVVDTFGAEYGLRSKEVLPTINVHVMTIVTGEEAAVLAGRVTGSKLVDYAEPNHRLRLQ